ncbi:MAG: Nif11-like leader peptide family natural product precursor [Arenicellales bacterium]|nr:Nif11-like leader peptide family natural product precursor [Arenicellales bacterium]
MSKENLEQFMNQVADSEALQARIGDEIDAEPLIALGAEHGCEFTAEELQESAELSDEGLDGAVGGLTAAEARVRETRRKSAIRRGRKQFVYGEGIRMVRVWI